VAVGLLIVTIDSFGHDVAWPLIAGGAVLCALAWWMLYRREAGIADPLLPLDLLRLPLFSLSVGTSIVSFVAQMLAFVSLPFILQSNYGFAPIEVGLLMMPWPLASAVAAPLAGRLSDRWSPALMCSAALAVFSGGLVLLALLPAEPAVADIAWRMALCGFGFSFFQAPNNRTLLLSAPKPRSAAASVMLSMARLTGQTIGAALVSLILGVFGLANASVALFVGAGFAAFGAVVSVTRVRLYDNWQRDE
jgi:DHA2 family multidrug resistance protein-like MFS transporter